MTPSPGPSPHTAEEAVGQRAQCFPILRLETVPESGVWHPDFMPPTPASPEDGLISLRCQSSSGEPGLDLVLSPSLVPSMVLFLRAPGGCWQAFRSITVHLCPAWDPLPSPPLPFRVCGHWSSAIVLLGC